MKTLVDSTVWTDFLRNKTTPQTERLTELILNRDDLCLCGFVLTEVLQGIRDEKQYVAVKQQFSNLLYLSDDASTFELGATIYRNLRRQGITIRNSIDCLIAATVVQHGVGLLENDRDYEFIDQHYPLNRWTV
ncbi:putative nucleic acid-binding protein [Opitutaceae bacterium TAV1]|nr:putative nucleic acid-binding protein [Opitutaceae bacterium TAV1]